MAKDNRDKKNYCSGFAIANIKALKKKHFSSYPIYDAETNELIGFMEKPLNDFPNWIEVNGKLYHQQGKINILVD